MTRVFAPPEITVDAISAACRMLGLPTTAFSGDDGEDPRQAVLKSLDTRDVEACPGSGKTTLLVAKLAILANLWSAPRQGLCVLSHTNVARREIEHRLGGTSAGQRLLAYPHFIGTIHGFINEFLALPWLRSAGIAVEVIDDDFVLRRRWRKVPYKIRAGLARNHHGQSVLKIRDAAFGVGSIPWGQYSLGVHTETYQALVKACLESTQEGYFCHDEMFVWAHDLLDNVPEVAATLRARFPLLFIDEVQDNSEQQSKILHRIFMEGDDAVIRQRYGDANQAIYQSPTQQAGATTDSFPGLNRADIPNSFRFGQELADLADPLAPAPQGLQGKRAPEGAENDAIAGKHAIFLFDDDSIGHVLGNYAAYLTAIFSEDELQNGVFTALGATHKPTGDDKIPRHVGHYWPRYSYAISRADPQPETFIQYIHAGRRLSHQAGNSHPLVEKIAEAVIRLARHVGPTFSTTTRKRKHRYVLDLLAGQPMAEQAYLRIVTGLAAEQHLPEQAEWETDWCHALKAIVKAITGSTPDGEDAKAFLSWTDATYEVTPQEEPGPTDNLFRYPPDNPSVSVRVSSIHAAKGETHTATLVLDTFYYAHHLKTLKPWLLGNRSGGNGESDRDKGRLRLHYVAMTRPSRLLCLALRKNSLNEKEITKLRERGWRIAHAGPNGPQWID